MKKKTCSTILLAGPSLEADLSLEYFVYIHPKTSHFLEVASSHIVAFSSLSREVEIQVNNPVESR